MNVLQFIETGGPGGAEKVVITLSKQLIKEGHNVWVATLREGWLTEELDKLNISRVKFNSKGSLDINLIKEIIYFCKLNKIEVIHSHLLDSNLYASISGYFANINTVCTEHGDIHHLHKKRFSNLKVKLISFFAKHITAVSEFSANALIKAGVTKNKISVVRNPIEQVAIAPTITKKRISNNIDDNDWLWVHVGNLRPVKDQETLLRAFAEVIKSSTQSQKLLVIGGGELEEKLKNLSKELNIDNQVIFLGFRDDVKDILPLCDSFILSSISEAMPISVLEAVNSNLIVICSNVGGISEIIKNEDTGFLFNVGDYKTLSKIMTNVINNQSNFEKMRFEAKKNLDHICKTEVIYKKLLEIYTSNN